LTQVKDKLRDRFAAHNTEIEQRIVRLVKDEYLAYDSASTTSSSSSTTSFGFGGSSSNSSGWLFGPTAPAGSGFGFGGSSSGSGFGGFGGSTSSGAASGSAPAPKPALRYVDPDKPETLKKPEPGLYPLSSRFALVLLRCLMCRLSTFAASQPSRSAQPAKSWRIGRGVSLTLAVSRRTRASVRR
jgi:hypothetical protein